ncbi:MAG: hypothetical protein LBN03_02140 [Bifidobacteriaceae bacterium]|jgi:hypothetical protein|nr:hypothetical protein [Bifidobacteriaceae bacterium]
MYKKVSILIIAIINIPFLYSFFTNTYALFRDDGIYHIERSKLMVETIINTINTPNGSIIPQYIQNDTILLGDISFVYMAPLLAYITFIFSFLGVCRAFNLTMILVTIFAYYSMKKLSSIVFQKNDYQYISAILYICSPYYLIDLYVRSAYNEVVAMSILPLLIYYVLKIQKTGKIIINKYSILLSLCISGIILVHTISTMIIPLFIIILLIIMRYDITSWINIICSFIMSIFMTSFFLIPLYKLYKTDFYNIFDPIYKQNIKKQGQNAYANDSIIILPTQNIYTSILAVIFVILVSILIWRVFESTLYKEQNHNTDSINLWKAIFIIAVLSATLTTNIVMPIFSIIQFPSRFLLVGTFSFTLIVVRFFPKLISRFLNISIKKSLATLLIVDFISVSSIYIWALNPDFYNKNMEYLADYELGIYIEGDSIPKNICKDHKDGIYVLFSLINGFEPENEDILDYKFSNCLKDFYAYWSENRIENDLVYNLELQKDKGYVWHIDYKDTESLSNKIEIGLFYYPNFHGTLEYSDGHKEDLEINPSDNSLVGFDVPADFDGIITFYYGK